MSDESGDNQLWLMHADGSSKKQLSKMAGGINDYGFNAQSNMIWFSKDVKVMQDNKDRYPDLPQATGKIYDDLMMRHWNEWEVESFSHIFIAPFSGDSLGRPMDIMPGEKFDSPMKPFGGAEQIAFSPDGKVLAYSCKKLLGKEYAVSTNSEVYVYDIAAHRARNITEGMEGYDMNPAFSPDGKQMLWLSMQ